VNRFLDLFLLICWLVYAARFSDNGCTPFWTGQGASVAITVPHRTATITAVIVNRFMIELLFCVCFFILGCR
jgi:hypothetical protein